MAFFSKKQNTEKKAEAPAPRAVNAASLVHSVASVLRNPRITEKGTMAGGQSAYLFDVAPSATKRSIAEAVSAVYKVKPRMVRRVTMRHKGGGHKRRFRIVDFYFDKKNVPARIASIEYDPTRSAFIALAIYRDGAKRY